MNDKQMLARKLGELFSDRAIKKDAIDILEEYGKEDYEQETVRVRLGILKLSAFSLNKLIKFTNSAKKVVEMF